MKTLCIAGSCQADLDFVHSLLTQAGMGEALPSSRDSSLTVDFWHQEVMSRLNQLTNQAGEIELGRVWEQLASDLFISNLDQPIWGWANPQSLALLDFWQAFDPQVRFVLVSSSVQRYVAHAIVEGEPVDGLNALIGRWVTEQFQMLNFYHRYPDKTLLIDMDHCIDQPAGLIKAMHQTWQLGLKKVHFPVQPAPQFPPLVRYLVEQVCETDHQWQTLQNELMSSVTPIGTLWKTPQSISIKEAINAVFEVEQEKNELRLILKENEREVEQNQQAVSVLEHQLQVKEEEYADMLSQFDELNKQLIQKKRKLEQSLNQAHLQSQQPDDSQLKTLNDRIKQLTEENQSLTNGLKDAQEEGELILLQLHQVQEELENYFLKYKDCENALELSNQRWKRLLSRMPDYFDLGHISVSMVGHESDHRLLWQFRDLEAAGRTLRDLTVVSFVEGEVSGLEFMREEGDQPVFLRWPVVAKDDDRLTIAVMGDAKTGVKRLETLMQVGRSDWDLIQVVIAALIQSLQRPDHLDLPASFNVESTLSGLKQLQSRLKSMPPVLRFDEIMLKREQVNPDYEHLWFDFKHVAVGAKRLLDFDFRVSCANLRPQNFGEYPKLEFPEASGRATIANWFDESYDDFGAKLELRFAQPQSMDLQVWSQLSDADQQFLSSLIHQLPALLDEIKASGVSIKRGWDQWHQLVNDMRRMLDICTASVMDEDELFVSPKPTKSRSRRKSQS